MRLPRAVFVGDTLNAYSNAMNLATTLVVPVQAGPNVFRYKIAINQMGDGTSCTVYNARLTVIFVP